MSIPLVRDNTDLLKEFRDLEKVLSEEASHRARIEQEAQYTLYSLKKANLEELVTLETNLLNQAHRKREQQDQAISKKLLAIRVDAELAAEKELAIKKEAELAKAASAAEKEAIEDKYKIELKKQQDLIKEKYKLDSKEGEKLRKKLQQQEAKENQAKAKQIFGDADNKFGIGMGKAAVEQLVADGMERDKAEQAVKDAKANAAFSAMADFVKQLNGNIQSIGSNMGKIDTRLQGSKNKKFLGSYWEAISADITKTTAVSPFVKQSAVIEKLNEFVGQGISFDVEQRAFLQAISEKIATTFNAADSSLLKLVRIQQADTTAARLGMESALTSFLNNMYETTEYMQNIASQVRSSLLEAESLMGAQSAAAFEYQVQKWMGSLYSVGMNDNSVSAIAGAIGQIASGNISGLTGSGTGNLVVMAANTAGISLADALRDGLDESNTNKLMTAMVNYLSGIYSETKSSKVVQQQFASVFGLTAADLKAAANLSSSIKTIANQNLNYSGMIQQLNNMANTMYRRTSMGEMLENMFDNLKYSISSGIANNPILYATYNIANMMRDTVGGIALPDIKVMGSGVNLQTSVADLMQVAALSGGMLSSIGKLIAGIATGSGGGFSGAGMLKSMGIGNGLTTVSRGNGGGLLTTGGASVSESGGYVGNTAGGDVYEKTMTDANDDANKQMVEAKDESTDITIKDVNENVILIYQLLDNVTSGVKSFKVDMGNSAAWSQAMHDRL